jgi:hypothetical protein
VTIVPVGANCTDIVQLVLCFKRQEPGVTWNSLEVSAAVAVPSRLPVLVTVNVFAALVPLSGADRDRDAGVTAKMGVLAALAHRVPAHKEKTVRKRTNVNRATSRHLGVWDDIELPPIPRT